MRPAFPLLSSFIVAAAGLVGVFVSFDYLLGCVAPCVSGGGDTCIDAGSEPPSDDAGSEPACEADQVVAPDGGCVDCPPCGANQECAYDAAAGAAACGCVGDALPNAAGDACIPCDCDAPAECVIVADEAVCDAPGEPGDACDDDAECRSRDCTDAGVCGELLADGEPCVDGQQCIGLVCVGGIAHVEGSICASECDDDGDCDVGLSCAATEGAVLACLPTASTGEPCDQAAICADVRCVDDADVAGDASICTRDCTVDADCSDLAGTAAEGYALATWLCAEDTQGGPACLPFLGNGAVGATCESRRDCADAICIDFGPDYGGAQCTVPCTDGVCSTQDNGWDACWTTANPPVCGPDF